MECKNCNKNNLLICLCEEEEEIQIDITDFIKENYEKEREKEIVELLFHVYVYKEAIERKNNNKGKLYIIY